MDEQPTLDSLLAHQPMIQLGPFLAGVIHDYNNSIGAVIAYGELLGMGSHTLAERDAMLEELLSAAKRIAELSDALSSAVRQESRKRSTVAVGKLVEHVVLLCDYRFKSRGIRLNVALEGELDRAATCYKHELIQAIEYLLLNAIENLESTPRKEVELAVAVDARGVTVRVRDHGPSLSAEQFNAALAPFKTSKPAPHLGLGLTAVKSTADLHGGELSYSAQSGFTLRIPHLED